MPAPVGHATSPPLAKPTVQFHPTPWRQVILVCRKCSKKLGNEGFGPDGKSSLVQDLKRTLRGTPDRRTTRMVETKCLGLCPKNAITLLPATAPSAMLTVAPGADTAALLPSLLQPPTA